MKILSSGDWHFSSGIDDDLADTLAYFVELAKDVDLVVLTGDLFDRRSTADSRNAMSTLLVALAGYSPVFMIYGNHEHEGELEIFARLKAKNPISVYRNPAFVVHGDVALYLLPWISKAGWMARTPQTDRQTSDQELVQAVLGMLSGQIRKAKEMGARYHALVGHLTIHGAKAENNQPLIGTGLLFGHHDLADLGLDAAILGHIHRHQQFGDRPYFYNGSPCAINFGEESEKFCTILDTETNELKWIRLRSPERTTIRAIWHDGQLQDEEPGTLHDIRNAHVRVICKVGEHEDAALVRKTIVERLGPVTPRSLKINLEYEPQQLVRAAGIAEVTSYADKLRHYWTATEKTPDAFEQDALLSILKNELEPALTGDPNGTSATTNQGPDGI